MVRKSLDEVIARKSDIDRAKIDAATEEDIRRHMIEDGEDPDAAPAGYELVVSPQMVRKRLGMTQEEFAAALRIPVATLRNWEQQRVKLDPAVRTLLAIVYRMPEALKALDPAA
jgi:putative transcriptional regulator